MSPISSTFTQRIIWREMVSRCLSLMLTPCRPVDFLNLVDQVLLQFLLAEHGQNVVRIARTVHERLAGLHPLALLNVDVDAARQRVFALLAVVADHEDLALPLAHFAVLHSAVDLRDDGRLARLARFEQFHHARQTAGDVLGLGGFARDLGQHVAGVNLFAVVHHQVGVRRHQVLLAFAARPAVRLPAALRSAAAASRRANPSPRAATCR